MKTIGQDSPSWFHKHRVASGYDKVTPLTTHFSVPKATLFDWEHGVHPPRWRHMPKVAELFHVGLTEAVKGLWRENVGDPCPCGCGGKKILPDYEGAQHLHIDRPCAKCGEKRIYRSRRYGDHHELCPGCAYAGRRGKRIEFVCVGYRDHDRLERHAPKCQRKLSLLASRIRYWHENQEKYLKTRGHDDNVNAQRPFLDEATGKYRCKKCASGSRAISMTEKKLKEITDESIRSQKQRSELLRENHGELYPSFVKNRLRGLKAAHAKVKSAGRSNSAGQIIGINASLWSGKVLPRSVRLNRCIVCDKLTFTSKARLTKFHKPCFRAWSQTPEARRYYLCWKHGLEMNLPSRKGRPTTEEKLKIYFAWTIQHHFGEKSLREIAKENGCSFRLVKQQIDLIINNLPAPDLLSRPFKSRISLLLEAAKG